MDVRGYNEKGTEECTFGRSVSINKFEIVNKT